MTIAKEVKRIKKTKIEKLQQVQGYIKIGHIDQLADATEPAWREQAVIKLLKKHSIGKSSDMALLIVFSSTKKSMDQLPTDHHPLLQVRIQSEHSGVIGSTKSATAWHMCRRNRQSCYAVNKSDSKCYTQPLPSIEKHCIWWYSIYVYTYIYIYVLKTKYLASTKKKWHWDVPTFSVVPVVFNVTFTVMLMRHRPSEALVLCVKFFTSVVFG